jgi:hypothetical protein
MNTCKIFFLETRARARASKFRRGPARTDPWTVYPFLAPLPLLLPPPPPPSPSLPTPSRPRWATRSRSPSNACKCVSAPLRSCFAWNVRPLPWNARPLQTSAGCIRSIRRCTRPKSAASFASWKSLVAGRLVVVGSDRARTKFIRGPSYWLAAAKKIYCT